MFRFHSFYPWHDKRADTQFEALEDAVTLMRRRVKEFNQFDLYSKGAAIPGVESLRSPEHDWFHLVASCMTSGTSCLSQVCGRGNAGSGRSRG